MIINLNIYHIFTMKNDEKDKRDAELCYLQIKLDDIKAEIDKNFQDYDNNDSLAYYDQEDIDKKIETIKEVLQSTREDLYKYQHLSQKYKEKTRNFELIKEKTSNLLTKKSLLEKHIKSLFSEEKDDNFDQRSKSVPKTREIEKKGRNICLTDRIIENTDEIGLMKLNNTMMNMNKTKKSRHEKCASNDFTLKKSSNGMIEEKSSYGMNEEEELNKSKVIRCKNNKECTRHQKSYRFNLENASAKEIELFENVGFFVVFF